jgi:hypothetical protein
MWVVFCFKDVNQCSTGFATRRSQKGNPAEIFTNLDSMNQGVKHTIKKNTSYFLTLTVVGWIDVFTRKNHKDAIIESLRYCIANKGLNIYCFCLMTNHLHLISNCNEPFELKDDIRDF